ncbi:hypothetical protein [Mycetocola miduiensis]|uniref:Uncharacterized protein n=1 Tax=Mycetocola miduiensis TaxID=995034 RepID=A0A1I5ATZ6_9MICO|nr:hypothetical protein [Mycetocola miduiensis]SFN65928.1 hypothetical protein SAMN05216219_1541 [Mycetocola miduiensis]
MRRIVNAWGSIREPRHIKTVFFFYYLVAIATGIVTLTMPPDLVELVLGVVLAHAFSVFLILGGLACAVSVFPGWWWLERIGCWSNLVGISLFLLVIVSLTVNDAADAGPTQAGVGMLSTGVFVIRLLMIRKYSFEPRQG